MNHDWYYCTSHYCSQQQISLLFITKGDKPLMVLHSKVRTSEKPVHQQHHHAILYILYMFITTPHWARPHIII